MALPNPINYTDKQDRNISAVADEYKVVAADMNQIKTKFNDLLTYLSSNVKQTIVVAITSADFDGNDYENANLVGLTPETDFQLISNNGSGTLLKFTGDPEDGYDFDAPSATITTIADNYLLIIHKPIS